MKTKKYPILYGSSKDGKIKEWHVEVKEEGEAARISISHGYTDGARTTKNRLLRAGKNLGRANATTPYSQALAEAKADWLKKIDAGYVEDKEDLRTITILPMLVHDYTKYGNKIKFPCYVQPKLNGVRCLAFCTEHGIDFYSRQGKLFSVLQKHTDLIEELKQLMLPGDILDGEIYVHNWRFQHIVAALKGNFKTSLTKKLEYHVYDSINRLEEFQVRNIKLGINKFEFRFVKETDTKLCRDHKEAVLFQQQYLTEGYEGLILRNKTGKYVPNYRSYDVQKYKTFIDEEFQIVGATHDADDGVIFVCTSKYANPRDNIFNVRPRGTIAERRQWWEECDKFFDKYLTVRYQELSTFGKPIFPVGINVRDYE